MNNTMGDEKKGSGALVGSVIIILIIIIGGIYMLKNAKVQNEEVNMINTDYVVEDLDNQSDSDELADIDADLDATNLEDVVPAIDGDATVETSTQ